VGLGRKEERKAELFPCEGRYFFEVKRFEIEQCGERGR